MCICNVCVFFCVKIICEISSSSCRPVSPHGTWPSSKVSSHHHLFPRAALLGASGEKAFSRLPPASQAAQAPPLDGQSQQALHQMLLPSSGGWCWRGEAASEELVHHWTTWPNCRGSSWTRWRRWWWPQGRRQWRRWSESRGSNRSQDSSLNLIGTVVRSLPQDSGQQT